MSSYRSYTSWKTSLPSSYKSDTCKSYSPSDDISIGTRYSTLATPATFRPSFSGGTYRIRREPPSPPATSYVNRYATMSKATVEKGFSGDGSAIISKVSQNKRYTGTLTSSQLSKYCSRDPSPGALERTNRLRSREPSPVARAMRGKSRDPSPGGVDAASKCKLAYSGASSFRVGTLRAPSTYSGRFNGANVTTPRVCSANPSITAMPDKSIGDLSVNNFRARCTSRASEDAMGHSHEKEPRVLLPEPAKSDTSDTESDVESPIQTPLTGEEKESFFTVAVVTRATSPTPPGSISTTVQRTRRIHIAKTMEKNVHRSTRRPQTLDKEIQSDRLDDSTRFSRFGLGGRVPSVYASNSEGRYTPGNLRYGSSSYLSSTATSNTSKFSSASSSTSTKEERRVAASVTKSKLSPPKVVRMNSRQSSVENLAGGAFNKPPAAPKAESPTKIVSSSSGSNGGGVVKWPNKDFRKSALNVGPTDRLRKSRTRSSSTDSDAVAQNGSAEHQGQGQNYTIDSTNEQRQISSPCGSEAGGGCFRRGSSEYKLRQHYHATNPKAIEAATAPAFLSRHNSSTNLKKKKHSSVTGALSSNVSSSITSAMSTSFSSSSAESASETRTPSKKVATKKQTLCTNNAQSKACSGGEGVAVKSADTAEKHLAAEKGIVIVATTAKVTESSSRSSDCVDASSVGMFAKHQHRLQRLTSVSNFFAARQNDTNSVPIFIESSESSGDAADTVSKSIGNCLCRTPEEDFKTSTSGAIIVDTSPNAAISLTTEANSTKSTVENPIDAADVAQRIMVIDSLEHTSKLSLSPHSDFNENLADVNSPARSSSDTAADSSTSASGDAIPETVGITNSAYLEEPSWWQDTSRQIDTDSALGFSHKDDVSYRLPHIDSGEAAWWLQTNDEDDTHADDVNTLYLQSQDDEIDEDKVKDSKTSTVVQHSNNAQELPNGSNFKKDRISNAYWWVSDCKEDDAEDVVDAERARKAKDGGIEMAANYVNGNRSCLLETPQYQLGSELLDPEPLPEKAQSWDSETNSDSEKQSGAMQNHISHDQSDESPWWFDEEQAAEDQQRKIDNLVLDATKSLASPLTGETRELRASSSNHDSSESAAAQSHWWQLDPNKKLFKVRRVESGEKAWWQQDDFDTSPPALPKEQEHSTTSAYQRFDSDETGWWLQSNEERAKNVTTSHQQQQESKHIRNWGDYGADDDDELLSNQGIVLNPELSKSFNFEYAERPPPLGQCASPDVGIEESRLHPPHPIFCLLPYNNIPIQKLQHNHDPPANTFNSMHQLSNGSSNVSHNYRKGGGQGGGSGSDSGSAKINYIADALSVEDGDSQQHKEKLFISRHQNIDELLGGSCRPVSPLFFGGNSVSQLTLGVRNIFLEEVYPDQVRIHDSTAQMPIIQRMQFESNDSDNCAPPIASNGMPSNDHLYIDDAAIQVYKEGDFGAYLDLESSLVEQSEEIDGINSSRKNSLVVRTQISVRVHAIIEKLLSAEGSDLRRALFSLKQVFQEDKDLVHAFVALGGLNCLVRVGNGADQNYQNYILRALGQVMLYVDGMNGVMKHEPTMQWLYSLIASNYRSVVKTALKLLLVFVEYTESNCFVLVNAIHVVDQSQGTLPWSNIMRLLKDYDNADAELVIYATSLINKALAGLNDQDSFYDESDLLEQQGMESVIQRYISKPGTDLDLLDQLQLYEAVLKFEDGESDGIRPPDNSMRITQRQRPGTETKERRKSRRHSTGTSPLVPASVMQTTHSLTPTHGAVDLDSSDSTNSVEFSKGVFQEKKSRDGPGVTPGLRRRRERAERHMSFLKEQQEAASNGIITTQEKREDLESENEEKQLFLHLKRDHTVKDLTQKLNTMPSNTTQDDKLQNRIVGDMSGLISKAKEGLAKSKSKGEMSRSSSIDQEIKKPEPKKSENDLHWEELVREIARPLNLCDLDFTDLNSEDEKDVLAPRGLGSGIPPPPPPIMMSTHAGVISAQLVPLLSCTNYGNTSLMTSVNNSMNGSGDADINTIRKNKKTVKLFWKEVREDLIPIAVGRTIWDELPNTNVDTQKLEHLFESRAKDLITKKQHELNKNKEVIVLDHKRSNAINIAMTKLPPPRAIKTAILKMDATVVTREGIDKLLNMLPTDEERGKIQEAQMSNPELPLGSAEQFLLTLASISELGARLKLWAFRLDFDNSEKEIAEPLMDLKQGIQILRNNCTFKCILSTLLSVGIFLNGTPVKGFQIEYLAKVPEVKDTVHKHSLLHHLCHMVIESGNETTDLYSEIGSITRASKADFSDLALNLIQLETECKVSWDRLKLIAKHDCAPQLKQKLVDFLADCAERIIILQTVHRRVLNRYRKFLLWLGTPQHSVSESKPNEFCRIISEFALEYRTTRERVQQQIEKKANHRERNKTRGKMIIDIAKFHTKEDRADAELKELLDTRNANTGDGTLTWRRRRAENKRNTPIVRQSEENFTDGDDEILESLVKTATKAPGTRTTPRERKRTRHADRKSLKRSRTREGFTTERAPTP